MSPVVYFSGWEHSMSCYCDDCRRLRHETTERARELAGELFTKKETERLMDGRVVFFGMAPHRRAIQNGHIYVESQPDEEGWNAQYVCANFSPPDGGNFRTAPPWEDVVISKALLAKYAPWRLADFDGVWSYSPDVRFH